MNVCKCKVLDLFATSCEVGYLVLVRYCSSKDTPMKFEHFGTIENPLAVLDGEYPSGTECYYQVEPIDAKCDTVLHFHESPFYRPDQCREWVMEVRLFY